MILLIIILIIVVLILWYIYNHYQSQKSEHFNEEAGRFCPTCAGKTINQCLRCFNCGFCVDKWGNSACIGGDMHGGYNQERCDIYYHNDPLSYMNYRNENYRCQDGPMSANRVIGI
jgi:hypothetical protein